ncbi:unnamed protein product [Rotaria sordida]|uniref:Uncharacterized protein n=2 Tax=Rotaria sordida TaxID=392033 RepID=A0A819DQS1_9BILA|nr:unnamed protein product [Rotaria sordida]CAF3835486.1 unnamed protein product [Rotaria sordida]
MTSEQKDRIWNGIDTQTKIENFQRQQQLKPTSSTLEQQTISDSNGNNQNDDNWESVQTRRNNKKRNTGNNSIDHRLQPKVLSNSSQIHSPSNQNRISSSSSSHSNQHQTNRDGNRLSITNYALDYASNYHFPPFELEYHYPNQLNNVKINSIPPNHLPPQHTVIIKWVNNSLIDDDICDE